MVAALVAASTSCSRSDGAQESAQGARQGRKLAWQDESLPQVEEALLEAKSPLLVLAGQSYPEESGIADFVLSKYGQAGNGPGARVLYWPRSFNEANASLRLLSGAASEQRPGIVVTIGAPEGTMRELRRIRDELPDVKIVSIFPSDDALGMEAVSDMVIDMDISEVESSGIGADIAEEEATALDITAREAAALLLGAALSMEESALGNGGEPGSVPLEAAMRSATEIAMRLDTSFAPTRWQYAQATDPDTGLRSRRHVLIRRTYGRVEGY